MLFTAKADKNIIWAQNYMLIRSRGRFAGRCWHHCKMKTATCGPYEDL